MKMSWRENSVLFSGHSQAFPMPARKKKIKASTVNPCQYSRLPEAKGKDGKKRGRIGKALFDPSFLFSFVGWFSLWICELQNFFKTKNRQKVRKEERKKKREREKQFICKSDLVWWMWDNTEPGFFKVTTATLSLPKKKHCKTPACPPLILHTNFCLGVSILLCPLQTGGMCNSQSIGETSLARWGVERSSLVGAWCLAEWRLCSYWWRLKTKQQQKNGAVE